MSRMSQGLRSNHKTELPGTEINREGSVWRLAQRRIHASVISLPRASRPNDANPASVNATTITVIASTAG